MFTHQVTMDTGFDEDDSWDDDDDWKRKKREVKTARKEATKKRKERTVEEVEKPLLPDENSKRVRREAAEKWRKGTQV